MWGLIAVAFLVILGTHWINKRRIPKCKNGVLPPGSMGLPFIGETLGLMFPSHSLDLHPFIKNRTKRYGSIFKTSLVGRPVVVTTDPEVNSYIFKEEGNMVEIHYMDTFSKIFNQDGETRTNAVGKAHKYLRSLPLLHFGREKLKDSLMPEIETMIDQTMRMWSTKDSVEVKHGTSNMLSDFFAKKLFSYETDDPSKKISSKMAAIVDTLLSFPLNIPGTAYHKCLKDKEEVMNILKNAIKERRSSQEMRQGDYLDQALDDLEKENFLTEEFVLILLYGILYAGAEANSSKVPFIFNFLNEHPAVWEELVAEHEAILKKRENPDSPLTWDEYRSMTFTHSVVSETLRLANIGPGLLRRALKDINIKGYTIPAGWMVMVVTPAYHLSSTVYKNPLEFNPWRWKDLEPHVIAKNFMPFGGGTRQCAGAEFGKAFLATFIHVLVTKYKWTKVKGGKCVRNPLLGYAGGAHIKFSQKQD